MQRSKLRTILAGAGLAALAVFGGAGREAHAQVPGSSAMKQDSVAERMLLYQRSNGGWPQPGGDPIRYEIALSEERRLALKTEKRKTDTTIDDRATTGEIEYLLTAYGQTRNPAYLKAAEAGIRYLLTAQKSNGGWAQFYPDSSSYHKQITFNDHAMINVLGVLKNTADRTSGYDVLDEKLIPAARRAVERGIDCILKTQYVRNGVRTAWCAQHDQVTLLPVGARTFELASLSGSESVGILAFLMSLDQPSEAIKAAVRAAVTWLDSVKISGIAVRLINDPSQPKGRDRVVVRDPNSTVWARFYELETDKPFFCGRDGVKKYSLAEIENERRAVYAWYGAWPAALLKKYPAWAQRWGVK